MTETVHKKFFKRNVSDRISDEEEYCPSACGTTCKSKWGSFDCWECPDWNAPSHSEILEHERKGGAVCPFFKKCVDRQPVDVSFCRSMAWRVCKVAIERIQRGEQPK